MVNRCRVEESNPRPTDYKSAALPTELTRRRDTLYVCGDPRPAELAHAAASSRLLDPPQRGFPARFRRVLRAGRSCDFFAARSLCRFLFPRLERHALTVFSGVDCRAGGDRNDEVLGAPGKRRGQFAGFVSLSQTASRNGGDIG